MVSMICGECNGSLSSHIPAPGTLAQPARAVPDVVDLRIECAADDFIRHEHRRYLSCHRAAAHLEVPVMTVARRSPPSREVKPAGKMIQRPATVQVRLVLLL